MRCIIVLGFYILVLGEGKNCFVFRIKYIFGFDFWRWIFLFCGVRITVVVFWRGRLL